MEMKVIGGEDLELNPEQQTALKAIIAVSQAVRGIRTPLGENLLTSVVAPLLVQAATATLAPSKCPYDYPPADILSGFDPNKNMYMHCLHAPNHCWNMSGQSITCPR